MPMNPPITQDSWSSVSERAKAEVRWRSGTSRWMVASSESLPIAWATPAVRPSAIAGISP